DATKGSTKGRSLKKLSDGDVYTLSIVATMWRQDHAGSIRSAHRRLLRERRLEAAYASPARAGEGVRPLAVAIHRNPYSSRFSCCSGAPDAAADWRPAASAQAAAAAAVSG